MINIPTTLPKHCHLWTKEPLKPNDLLVLQPVERYIDDGHFIRQLMRCRDCGQYYYKELVEHTDWVGGNDPQYRTYIPIKYDHKVIKQLNALNEFDLQKVSPRIVDNWGADGKRRIFWAGQDVDRLRKEQILADQQLLERAEALARKYHAGAVRKGDGSAYINHPKGVAAMLAAEKFPPPVIAAGWCHDLLEDTDCSQQEIVEACGAEVLQIVQTVTNDKSLPWKKRKRQYIATVRRGTKAAKAVCLMDKIYNLQDLLRAYEKQGPALWSKFNRGKKDKYWFESSVLAMLQETWDHPLIGHYQTLVKQMSQLKAK